MRLISGAETITSSASFALQTDTEETFLIILSEDILIFHATDTMEK